MDNEKPAPPTPPALKSRNVSAAFVGGVGSVTNPRRLKTTYADWITKAILSAPTKSLALAEINEWMASNVPGLKDQKFLHSSQGWKNAVRHTLSVNRGRFEKIPREGRPSLWTLTEKYGLNLDDRDMCTNTDAKFESDIKYASSAINVVVGKASKEQTTKICSSVANVGDTIITTAQSPMKLAATPPSSSNPTTEADPSTQAIQVVFNDGVVAVVVLPKPLPVCSYGGSPEASLFHALNPLGGIKPLWDDSQAAFLTQALLRHRSSSAQSAFPIAGCFG